MIAFSDITEAVSRTRPADFNQALLVAVAAHQEQKNKFNGEPYILHVFRVIHKVHRMYADSEDLQDLLIVAALHDVVEDTHVSLTMLRGLGFSEYVLGGVLSVTRYKGVENYTQFIMRVAGHPLGQLVKQADILDHLESTEPVAGMHRRYSDALLFLRTGYTG